MAWYRGEREDNLEVVTKHLKNYLTACKAVAYEQDVTKRELLKLKIKEVDELIDNKLINAIGITLEREYKKGVSHDYSYVQSNGKAVMYVGNTPYCSSLALTPQIEKELGVTDTKRNDVDGKRLDYVIDEAKSVLNDYCTTDELDFHEKYVPPIKLNGSDVLVQILIDKHNTYPTNIDFLSLKNATGEVKNIEDLALPISRFIGESGEYSVKVQDGKMIIEDCFQVDKIECHTVFRRNEIDEKFKLAEMNLYLFNNNSKFHLTVRTAVSDNVAIAYGEVVDSQIKRIDEEMKITENYKKIVEMSNKSKGRESKKKQSRERED